MVVQISGDIPSSEDELDPQYVATAFVEQYYLLLRKSPEIVHKFYSDESVLDHPGPDGEMTSVMTLKGINDKIMSSDYKGCSFETINVDAQGSLAGGILVAVNGYFNVQDKLKRSFYQTFFLAKQAKGYFVLNDILRFMEVLESETLLTSNGTKENASDVPLTHDQETPDVPAQTKEVIYNGEKASDVDSGEKASDGETGKDLSDVKTGKKPSDDGSSKKASDIDSGKNASDIDISDTKVSDIKTVAQVPNFSVSGSENESTPSHVASNEKQDSKKTSHVSMRKNASDIDSSKKKVSDIKDIVDQVPNSSVSGSENESTPSHVASNEKQDSKKTSYASMGKNAPDIDSSKKKVSDIKVSVAQVPNSSVSGSENEATPSHVASNEKQDSKKTSYASMVAKESKVAFPTHNSGYKIVRVAANADQQSIAPATPRDPGTIANSAKKELTSKIGAAENNNAYADALTAKSIYIANLPPNITKRGLVDALNIFGRVRPGGVQIRTFEDGFCFGFVEFESASAASKAVEVHYVTVGGYEAYMMYKKSGSRSGNSSGVNGGFRNVNFKGQENEETHGDGSYQDDNQVDLRSQPQGSGGQSGETNQKSQSTVGRAHSKGRQMSDERLPAGEAYRKNSQRRDERGKSGDAYQKNKKKQ